MVRHKSRFKNNKNSAQAATISLYERAADKMKTEYQMFGGPRQHDKLAKHLFCERCWLCVHCKDCRCKNPK